MRSSWQLREALVSIAIIAAGVWLGSMFAPPEFAKRAIWLWLAWRIFG